MKNPATIQFAAQRQHKVNVLDEDDSGCRGCLFEHERFKVCQAAGVAAKERKLPDCDDGFIYVAVAVDPRQQDLFNE